MTREALINEIREAFAGVKLGGGHGLREADALDGCQGIKFSEDERHDWSRITAEDLSSYSVALSFFDEEGMRFHLPAFMIAEVRGEFGEFSIIPISLTNFSDYKFEQLALLSTPQQNAYKQFLKYLADHSDDAEERERIRTVIKQVCGRWS